MHALEWWRQVQLVCLGRDSKVGLEGCLCLLDDRVREEVYYLVLVGVYDVQAREGECLCLLVGVYAVQVKAGEC